MGEMNHNGRKESEGISPRDAWLLSYLDNELVPEQRAQFEAWLARDPAARAEVEEHSLVTDLFAEAEIEEPAWDETLAGIRSALRQKPVPAGRPHHGAGWPLLWLVTAAAVLAGVWLGAGGLLRQSPRDEGDGNRPAVPVLEVAGDTDIVIDDMDPLDASALVLGKVPDSVPTELRQRVALEVASGVEIGIITMDGDDTGNLIVGDPPVQGPLLLASPGEVKVHHIATGKRDEPLPYLHEPGGGMPMIMVPFKSARVSKD
jgi:hypothetical protein